MEACPVKDFTGTVSASSLGRIGLVTGKRTITFASGETKDMWEGIGLDGKGLWCSSNPIVIQLTIEAYMNRLREALEQPGCVYPPLGCGSLNPLGSSTCHCVNAGSNP